jgi:TPR repeat protein
MGIMETQEAASLIVALAGVACIGFGIFALFKGLKAEGAIQFAELDKGKCGLAGAGVLLLLFGTIITTVFLLHGNDQPRVTMAPSHESNSPVVVHRESTPLPVEKLSKVTKPEVAEAAPPPVAPRAQPPEASDERFQQALKAANSGEPKALHELGLLYAIGAHGAFSQDLKKACEYFQLAADKNYVPAKHALGDCYLDGKGVPKNEAKGLNLLREAAVAKDHGAMTRLGAYLARYDSARPPGARKEDLQEAFNLLSESSGMGDLDSLLNLGVMYMNGLVPGSQGPDSKKGATLFAEGARKGHVVCMFDYGQCLEKGIGIKPNQIEAQKWFRKAAGLGNLQAKAWCREHGVDVPTVSPTSLQVPSTSSDL